MVLVLNLSALCRLFVAVASWLAAMCALVCTRERDCPCFRCARTRDVRPAGMLKPRDRDWWCGSPYRSFTHFLKCMNESDINGVPAHRRCGKCGEFDFRSEMMFGPWQTGVDYRCSVCAQLSQYISIERAGLNPWETCYARARARLRREEEDELLALGCNPRALTQRLTEEYLREQEMRAAWDGGAPVRQAPGNTAQHRSERAGSHAGFDLLFPDSAAGVTWTRPDGTTVREPLPDVRVPLPRSETVAEYEGGSGKESHALSHV